MLYLTGDLPDIVAPILSAEVANSQAKSFVQIKRLYTAHLVGAIMNSMILSPKFIM